MVSKNGDTSLTLVRRGMCIQRGLRIDWYFITKEITLKAENPLLHVPRATKRAMSVPWEERSCLKTFERHPSRTFPQMSSKSRRESTRKSRVPEMRAGSKRTRDRERGSPLPSSSSSSIIMFDGDSVVDGCTLAWSWFATWGTPLVLLPSTVLELELPAGACDFCFSVLVLWMTRGTLWWALSLLLLFGELFGWLAFRLEAARLGSPGGGCGSLGVSGSPVATFSSVSNAMGLGAILVSTEDGRYDLSGANCNSAAVSQVDRSLEARSCFSHSASTFNAWRSRCCSSLLAVVEKIKPPMMKTQYFISIYKSGNKGFEGITGGSALYFCKDVVGSSCISADPVSCLISCK